MIRPQPTTLEGYGMRLEPLTVDHRDDLAAAASGGQLWELWFTSVPDPERVDAYISTALEGQERGHMLPWVVRELETGVIAGTTRYHDIVPDIDRVEIGYTQEMWMSVPANSVLSDSASPACAALVAL